MICLLLTIAVLLISLAVIIFKKKLGFGGVDATHILMVCVALSIAVLSFPVFSSSVKNLGGGVLESVALAIHNVIRFFVVDADFEFMVENVYGVPAWIFSAYSILFSALILSAPVLTFGFVLSFFKNASAYQKYFLRYSSDVYMFSELNDSSYALAKSILQNQKKRVAVFTGVDDQNENYDPVLFEKTEALGAICFKMDAVTANLSFHKKSSNMHIFVIGENQSENVKTGLKLIDKYKVRKNTSIYIFATQEESELLLLSAFSDNPNTLQDEAAAVNCLKIRCINEVQSLVLRTLYDDGYKLFANAVEREDGKKEIAAMVVGLGDHGTEMVRALSWFCQMDGYALTVNAYDLSESAESEFCFKYPELLHPPVDDSVPEYGDARYSIRIHSGVNIKTHDFMQQVMVLPRVTYVFIALGDDDRNVATAVKLRSLFERKGISPQIQAVVYDSNKKYALSDIRNFKGQKHNIEFIGDLDSSFTEEVILNSEVEQQALQRHLRWGAEEDFWRFSYNYRSSVASAIHKKMKRLCKIPGAEKEPSDRTEEELWNLRRLEHRRWNAYMRSEGYTYAPVRNDLAKVHHCLVPFDDLPLKEQVKDDD